MPETIPQIDIDEEVRLFGMLQDSPVLFAEIMFGLTPERDNSKFIKGKHLTWQQHDILLSIEKAIRGEAPKKISIASGHGIGKTGTLAMVILWFLFCHYDCQIPCTAPTADQMYDVLWKELNLWINKMPEGIREKFIWESSHIRMAESPQTWFARAKTASKENTEALAGVHADNVLIVADEASGIADQIFNTAEGSMTGENTFVILTSNPTRIDGYFYETHHAQKEYWQPLQFSSIDSPLVDREYVKKIEERHGPDSTEYKIRVLGQFPAEDSIDDGGYVALLLQDQIKTVPDDNMKFSSNAVLGVDPAGDGDDKTSFVIRDQFKAMKLFEEKRSTPKSVAEKIMTLIDLYRLSPRNVVVDNFGIGADVGKEVALASRGKFNITTVNTGEKCEYEAEQEEYLNKRALCFYELRKWVLQGGVLVQNSNLLDELRGIKYRRNLQGKIQIMPKLDMKKKYGLDSPNDADALSLTFLRTPQHSLVERQQEAYNEYQRSNFNKWGV